jgi:hypothetical protein
MDFRLKIVSSLGFRLGFAFAMLAPAGGCGSLGDNAASMIVAPGKYEYYSCEQLNTAGRPLIERERELTELNAKAVSGGPGGEFVGALAYRSELTQTRGQLKQIADVSARKNCSLQSRWQSDRALW